MARHRRYSFALHQISLSAFALRQIIGPGKGGPGDPLEDAATKVKILFVDSSTFQPKTPNPDAQTDPLPVSVTPVGHTHGVNSTCANGHQHLAGQETVRSGDVLLAAVCPDCKVVNWWLNGAQIECWDGAMLGFGRAVITERLAAVGAPGDEVLVCRPPAGTRLAWLPLRRWVEAAPQLFVAREGRRLLMSSPNPALTGVLTSRKSHLALLQKPVPV